jgi:hypothetical protein
MKRIPVADLFSGGRENLPRALSRVKEAPIDSVNSVSEVHERLVFRRFLLSRVRLAHVERRSVGYQRRCDDGLGVDLVRWQFHLSAPVENQRTAQVEESLSNLPTAGVLGGKNTEVMKASGELF